MLRIIYFTSFTSMNCMWICLFGTHRMRQTNEKLGFATIFNTVPSIRLGRNWNMIHTSLSNSHYCMAIYVYDHSSRHKKNLRVQYLAFRFIAGPMCKHKKSSKNRTKINCEIIDSNHSKSVAFFFENALCEIIVSFVVF